MRPLRPLFNRHNRGDELERDAERLKNRDWVEILRVVHPSQAELAEREYLLARLGADWAELTSPLLATHSQPGEIKERTLTVLCDHNTFANELSMISPAVEKKIEARYGISLKIKAKASRAIHWRKNTEGAAATEQQNPPPPKVTRTLPVIDALIARLSEE